MKSWALVFLGAGIIAGCGSTEVRMEDRDTTGQYDGDWTLTVLPPTARLQTLPGNWRIKCNWEEFSFPITVADGVVSAEFSDAETPVGGSGSFYLAIPTDRDIGMQRGVMSGDSSITVILDGDFSSEGGEGNYIRGISNLQNNGCRSRFETVRA